MSAWPAVHSTVVLLAIKALVTSMTKRKRPIVCLQIEVLCIPYLHPSPAVSGINDGDCPLLLSA
jgi:hypothetical protein